MTVVPLNPDAHAAVQVMLPWYASGLLDAEERAEVEAHLAACPRCQAELEAERRLMAAHRALDTAGDIDRGLAVMRERLTKPSRPQPFDTLRRRLPTRFGTAFGTGALRGLALAQAVVIAVLGGLLLTRGPDADYRLLGTPGPAGNIVVKFRDGVTEAQVRRAVRDSGARIADGPTASDAWLLSVPAGHEVQAVQRLRADPAVVLAESLAPGGTQ
jgi:hypothetical protein